MKHLKHHIPDIVQLDIDICAVMDNQFVNLCLMFLLYCTRIQKIYKTTYRYTHIIHIGTNTASSEAKYKWKRFENIKSDE